MTIMVQDGSTETSAPDSPGIQEVLSASLEQTAFSSVVTCRHRSVRLHRLPSRRRGCWVTAQVSLEPASTSWNASPPDGDHLHKELGLREYELLAAVKRPQMVGCRYERPF